MGPAGPGRLGLLNETRLRALVASLDPSWPSADTAARSVAVDEMVGIHNGSGRGYALILAAGPKAFGMAMVWAARFEISDLTLMVDPDAGPGDHARRAAAFAVPPTVMVVDGARLIDADPAPSRVFTVNAPDGVDTGVALLRSAGLDVVIDDGAVIGEYLGLEVARVISTDDGGDVQVGVGAIDREANRMLHGDATPEDVLRRVVSEVASHRRAGAEFHPLSRMARERWLMRTLIDDPALIDVAPLVELAATEPRRGLRNSAPVGALAEGPNGPVLVMATAGADVSVVGVAADLVIRETPARLIVVAESPLIPQLIEALDRLKVPVAVAEGPAPWM